MTVATEQNLLQKIMKSEIGQKILGKEKLDTLKKRKGAVEAINQLKSESGLIVPPLRKECGKELEKVRECEKKLEAAKMRHGEAYRKMYGESHSFNTAISKHEVLLRKTYDPAVDKFLEEMNSLMVHCREAGPELLKREQVRDSNSLALSYQETFDTQRHKDTLGKVEKIYEQADAMKLEAVEDVPAKLNELRESIPNNCYTSGHRYYR